MVKLQGLLKKFEELLLQCGDAALDWSLIPDQCEATIDGWEVLMWRAERERK